MAYFNDDELITNLSMMVVVSLVNALSIEQNITPQDVRDEDILTVVNWAEHLQEELLLFSGMGFVPDNLQKDVNTLYAVMSTNLLPRVRDGELTFVSGWVTLKNQERLHYYANPDRRL